MTTDRQPKTDYPDCRLLVGDALHVLRSLPECSVQTCVTSPPYFGLRSYLPTDHPDKVLELGSETTLAAYVDRLVDIFAEVRRVLREDGIVFLNLGDSYFGSSQTGGTNSMEHSAKPLGRMFKAPGRGQGAHVRDIDGKASSDWKAHDSLFGSRNGARKDSWWNHIVCTDLRHAIALVDEPLRQIQAYTGALLDHLPNADSQDPRQIKQSSSAILAEAQTAIPVLERLHASLPSMLSESYPPPPAGFRLSDMLWACRSSLLAFAADAQRCAGTPVAQEDISCCTADNALRDEELQHHIRCIATHVGLVLSWLNIPPSQPQYTTGLKAKDLLGVPWRVAFALQDAGWWLRSDIIWHKPSPMPESVSDRPTSSHEHLFLLAKSERYYYDAAAIAESTSAQAYHGSSFTRGKTLAARDHHAVSRAPRAAQVTRNKRDVWTIASAGFPGAHYATFPPKLVEPCILAGSRPGDTVLDPFFGSGVTGLVARSHGRSFIGIDLDERNIDLARHRIGPMLLDAPSATTPPARVTDKQAQTGSRTAAGFNARWAQSELEAAR